jgi:hypothetical protein
VSAFPRPASLGPDTLSAAAAAVRPYAGAAWDSVAAWETEARAAWGRLAEHPWKSVALGECAARLARSAPRLVEGTASALFRAARARLPWDLDADPFRATGRELAAFCAAARALLELAAEQERAAERLAGMQARWAGFPRAWSRWTRLLDLDAAEPYAGDTLADLQGVHERMDQLEGELAAWRDEVDAWLVEHGGPGGDAALDVSEARYLALLSIGAADRKAALQRAAALTRRATRAQLDALPDDAAPPRSALVRELAHHWSDLPPEAPLTAEEVACYRAALGNAYARSGHAERPGGHVAGDADAPADARGEDRAPRPGRILYATPLDRAKVGQDMIVVRRLPETPLQVELGGTDRTSAFMEVALADSAPALGPGELADVRRFFEDSDVPVHPYWWATASPARVRLQQVRGGTEPDGAPSPDAVFVGVLEARGRLRPLPAPPAPRPRIEGNPPLFRAYAPPDPKDVAQHLDRDPRVRPLDSVFQSPDVECWVAEVPEYGPGRVWLRTSAEAPTASVNASTFDGEAELLHHLTLVLPGSAVRVAHRGTVDLRRRGRPTPYLATMAPVGHPAEKWFRAAGAERASAWGVDVALDLLRTLGAAHAGEFCVGDLAPPLVRVRPAFHAAPPVLRATLAAAPLAGRVDESFEDAVRRAPGWAGSPSRRTHRSPRGDLIALGHFLSVAVVPVLSPGDPLRALAAELRAGGLPSADEALAWLKRAVPAQVAHFRTVLPRTVRSPGAGAAGAAAAV